MLSAKHSVVIYIYLIEKWFPEVYRITNSYIIQSKNRVTLGQGHSLQNEKVLEGDRYSIREKVVAQTQKLRAMHSVEGTTFASQAGCKLANNTLTTHFVETAVFIVCLGTTFSTRCQFSTKCKPARLKPHQMPMTMFLYRITNLQISIFQKLRNVSSTKCQTWECKTSFSINKCLISVPNPWHSVEDTGRRIYIYICATLRGSLEGFRTLFDDPF